MRDSASPASRVFFAAVVVAVLSAPARAQESAPPAAPLPAFPGAEGFGAAARGGRGGRLIEVTNLNPEGPGSFREACEAAGPRTIVFRVGGAIVSDTVIRLREPFVTIAGQTAPGDGICLRRAGLSISTHDVIVRGLHIRIGDDIQGPPPVNRDGISIGGRSPDGVSNVIVDHCSISWAIDEDVSTTRGSRGVTVQWCLIGEGLSNSLHPKLEHSKGFLVGDHSKRITIHHNLFVHNDGRNVLLKGDTESEVIDNVIYDWGNEATNIIDDRECGPSLANIVANYYLPGPSTLFLKGVRLERPFAGSRVFVRGNIGPTRQWEAQDDWDIVRANTLWRSETPVIEPSGVAVQPALLEREIVLRCAGASPERRDAVDARLARQVLRGEGRIINSPADVGGWPEYKNAQPPPDADHDGLPDAWEVEHGLNPADPLDAAKTTPSGYTWLETYLNSLIPAPAQGPSTK